MPLQRNIPLSVPVNDNTSERNKLSLISLKKQLTELCNVANEVFQSIDDHALKLEGRINEISNRVDYAKDGFSNSNFLSSFKCLSIDKSICLASTAEHTINLTRSTRPLWLQNLYSSEGMIQLPRLNIMDENSVGEYGDNSFVKAYSNPYSFFERWQNLQVARLEQHQAEREKRKQEKKERQQIELKKIEENSSFRRGSEGRYK